MEGKIKLCSNCHRSFKCGPAIDGRNCWCNHFPQVLPVSTSSDCLCQECLLERLKVEVRAYTDKITIDQANEIDLTAYRTAENVEGIDFYVENGLYVFTKWYHLKRGQCCASGCRHCPFGFKI